MEMKAFEGASAEMLKGIQYMIDSALSNTTKIYNGIIKSENDNGTWNIQFNGKVHAIKPYGAIVPKVGTVVKVIIPDNNMTTAFFI